jgi:hypothetical protein
LEEPIHDTVSERDTDDDWVVAVEDLKCGPINAVEDY